MSTQPAAAHAQNLDGSRAMVRHLIATLAYRASKVLRDVPASFHTAAFGSSTRRPVLIVAHMADLMAWALTMARGSTKWTAGGGEDWNVEVQRFFDGLAALDSAVAADDFAGSCEKLIQAPLADALTHVGQLAMLRGMAGCPVKPESYAKADIVAGRIGLEQSPPGFEFTGDASTRR
jgi:hypothetical protein